MPDQLSILTPGKFSVYEVSEHGITFTDNISREQWLSVMKRLCGMVEGAEMTKQRALMLVADAANFGEERFGEEYAQAINGMREALGLTPKTIANAQFVYKRIEPSRRRDGLTLGHMSVIASLDAVTQDQFMDMALADPKNTFTVQRLKDEVAAAFPKTKRGRKRKTKAHRSDSASTALQKLIDASDFIEESGGDVLTEAWKSPLEKLYKAFRRKWASGRKKK